jgi:hypothetical protein
MHQLVPFVTPTLRLIWLHPTIAPASLVAYYTGTTPTFRLTPAVFAHLHHAADKRIQAGGVAPESAAALINAVGSVYAALVTVYEPADVHPFDPARTPPLPKLPALPPEGTPACDLDRGIVSELMAWSIGRVKGPNPMKPMYAGKPVSSGHAPERPPAKVRAGIPVRSKRHPGGDPGGLF